MYSKNHINIKLAFIFFLFINSGLHAFVSDFRTQYDAGEKAFSSKNYKLAAQYFEKAVKAKPMGLRSNFRLGQSLFYLKNYSNSYSIFQNILSRSPNNIQARIFLVKNLISLNKKEEATTQLTWILKIQPSSIEAKNLLDECRQPKLVKSITQKLELPEKIPEGFQPLPVREVSTGSSAQPTIEYKQAKQNISTHNQSKKIKNINLSKIPEAIPVKTWNISNFLSKTTSSFGVNLEYSKYCIEKGDLETARKSLARAAKLAEDRPEAKKRFLETQILSSLVYIYSKDFAAFGKNLLRLKSVLSKQSYKSFLDIYNKARQVENKEGLTKLSAGVAMGAGHYKVAEQLFSETLYSYPDDKLTASMLAETQIQCQNYDGAEQTMIGIAEKDPKNFEVYFNLAKFYLTAKYKPNLSYKYTVYAKNLNPNDERTSVLFALLDYSEGKTDLGIARLKKLLPTIANGQFKVICQRMIADGERAIASRDTNLIDFTKVLALPGAKHAAKDSLKLIGVDYLKKRSYMTAMRYFLKANDIAEVGRAYLGLASSLASLGENKASALAAGCGRKALLEELIRNPDSGRANLYLALYSFERNDFISAKKSVESGLSSHCEKSTKRKLAALLNQLKL